MGEAQTSVLLEDWEIDAIGEILNISMGSSATAISSLLDRQVIISTPTVEMRTFRSLDYAALEPAMLVKIEYVEGISGNNVMIFRQRDMQIILNLLMGNEEEPTDDFVFDELSMSAACEVMNQMMGAAATALSEFLSKVVNISTPVASVIDSDENYYQSLGADEGSEIVSISFHISIEGVMDSDFSSIMSCELVKDIVTSVSGQQEQEIAQVEMLPSNAAAAPAPAAPQPEPAAPPMGYPPQQQPAPGYPPQQPAAAQQPAPGYPPQQPAPGYQPQAPGYPPQQPAPGYPPQQPAAAQQPAPGYPPQQPAPGYPQQAPGYPPQQPAPGYPPQPDMSGYQQQPAPGYPPYPQMPPYGYPAYPGYPYPPYGYGMPPEAAALPNQVLKQPLNVQNTQFPAFGVQQTDNPASNSNMDLLMGVSLDVSVEIGQTKRKIKDIIDFGQGTVIELNKQAGAPVDIVVNGRLLARGDVVVIGDNFGVRITEIVGTKELMESLKAGIN